MPNAEQPNNDGQLFTRVDDEQYDELSQLNGQPVVHISVWEEGLTDSILLNLPQGTPKKGSSRADDASTSDDTAADLDVYLRDGVYFELYGTLCYTDLDAAPIADLEEIDQRLQQLIKAGVVLDEVAVDEDEGLVLVLAQHHRPVFYLQVGAWLLDEWEELPDTSAP